MLIRLILMAFVLVGCTTPPPVNTLTAPPPDFALSLTLVGDAPEDSPLAAAWYVVLPNGQLRAAVGQRLATSPIPPVVRQLTDAQMSAIWEATRQSGALEAPVGGLQVADGTLPKRGAAVYTVAGGRGRVEILDGSAERMEAVARLLRELAWVGR